MKMPWQKETRAAPKEQSQDFPIISDFFNASSIIGAEDITQNVSAVQKAASVLFGQAMALAEFERGIELSGVTPSFLADLAERIMIDGEAVYYLGRDFQLVHAADATIEQGDYDPRTWVYRLHLPGPNITTDLQAPYSSVLHFQWRRDPRQPWRSVNPFHSPAARAALDFERSLAADARAITIQFLPIPLTAAAGPNSIRDGDSAVKDVKIARAFYSPTFNLIRSAKGGLVSGASFRGTGTRTGIRGPLDAPTAAGRDEQGADKPERWGPEPNQSQIAAYEQVARLALSSVGIPGELILKSDGTTMKEALRQFYVTGVLPFAQMVQEEISRKLVPVNFTFDRFAAADVQARSRAMAQFIQAGMSLPDALEKVGLPDE